MWTNVSQSIPLPFHHWFPDSRCRQSESWNYRFHLPERGYILPSHVPRFLPSCAINLGGLFLRYLVAAVIFHIQRVERFCRYSHNIMFRIVYYWIFSSWKPWKISRSPSTRLTRNPTLIRNVKEKVKTARQSSGKQRIWKGHKKHNHWLSIVTFQIFFIRDEETAGSNPVLSIIF